MKIEFHILQPKDKITFRLIANWYLREWNIPINKTIERLQSITGETTQFQIIMILNGNPISTGGLYHHVGLLDKETRFQIYKNWLALVYTIPDQRGKGFGAKICDYIELHSKSLGIKKMNLFTDTSEKLYKRLGWTEIERLKLNERNIVVMEKQCGQYD